MTLKEFKHTLKESNQLSFKLPNGKMVPKHFHITELGLHTNHFIDCGGTVRKETKINFQLWESIDFHHRLKPEKLNIIIEKAESVLNLNDNFEIQVEYQQETVSLFHITFKDGIYLLGNTKTDCLASELCGFDMIEKTKKQLSSLGKKVENCCTPSSRCC